MLNLYKRVLQGAIRHFGLDIIRVVEPRPTPQINFKCTDLLEYRGATSFIPGMITPEAAELLYGIAVAQDIEGDILEIGSWQGKSTSYLARAVVDSRNGHMFAVDHFKGNEGKEDLYFIDGHGSADLKTRFEQNMHVLGLQDAVTLLPYPSSQAFPKLADRVIRFLFIDGDHTEQGVKKDIELFCPLVRNGGVVVFDDFNTTSPGVILAAEQWVKIQRPRSSFIFGNMLVCKI